jgi:molybdate transport repressor ModE-like protein
VQAWEPLVESTVGGKGGGGARLTFAGVQTTKFFQVLNTEMADAAARALRKTLNDLTAINSFARDSTT